MKNLKKETEELLKEYNKTIKNIIWLRIKSNMNETHLQIGSKKNFEKALLKLGVEKKLESPIYTSFYGLNIIENTNVPQDKAWLIDKDGRLLEVFDLLIKENK